MAKPDSMIAAEAFCGHHRELLHLILKWTGVWGKKNNKQTIKQTKPIKQLFNYLPFQLFGNNKRHVERN